MATLTIANSSSQIVARTFLNLTGIDIGEDEKNSFGGENDVTNLVGTVMNIVSAVHRGQASGDTTGLVGTPSVKPTKFAFTSTAFSTPNSDIVADFIFAGKSLQVGGMNPTVSGMNIGYRFTDYPEGLQHTSTNSTGSGTGTLSAVLNYQVAPWANDVTGDGTATATEFKQSNKGNSIKSENGIVVRYAGTSSNAIKGTLALNDDNSFSGLLNSWAVSNSRKGSDKSSGADYLKIASKSGIAVNDAGSWTGTLDTINFSKTYKSPAWSESISFKSTGADAHTAAALGEFFQGRSTIDEFAVALFAGNDTIKATSGNNTLNGYAGNDKLVGGKGNDTFQFTTALQAASNVDQIVNFKKAGTDRISLDRSVFAGADEADSFVTGVAATAATHRIIFNSISGALYYDADGNGEGAAVQFATIVGKVSLSATDIIVF